MVLLEDFPFVMVTGFIYLRISPSGKGYIGQAINLDSRDNAFIHVNHPYGGRSIENARKKYPPKLWRRVVLATVNAKDRVDLRVWLDALEVYFIWHYKTADKHYGYNITRGGNSRGGYHHSEETRIKLGLGNKGKTISAEVRARISKKLRGRKRSLEARIKSSLALRGKKQDSDWVTKRVMARKGKPIRRDSVVFTEEYRERKRQLSLGRVHTQESKDLVSLSKGFSSILIYDRSTGVFLGEFQTRVAAASFCGIYPHAIARAFSDRSSDSWVLINDYAFAYASSGFSRVSLCENGYVPTVRSSKRMALCFTDSGDEVCRGTVKELSVELGLPMRDIQRVCRGDRVHAGPYMFRFIDDVVSGG